MNEKEFEYIVENTSKKIKSNLFTSNNVIRIAYNIKNEEFEVYKIEKDEFVESDITIVDFSLDIQDYEHILDKYDEYINAEDYAHSQEIAISIIQDYIDNNLEDLKKEVQAALEDFERRNQEVRK